MFVLMKSRMSVKMGHVGSQTRSLGQMLEKPCVCSRGNIFSPIIIRRVRKWVMSGQKLGQMLEKPCVRSRGHICCPIIMKHGQNVCLVEISGEFVNGSCRVKNKVTWSNLRKTFCTL